MAVEIVADPYKQVREKFLNWLTPEIGQPGQTYPGQLVAPLSSQENQSFDFLRQYGEGGITASQPFQQGKAEISKTLSGDYNPATSPYYQAVKAQASFNLADTQKQISNQAAGGGRYWAGARLKSQQEAASASDRGLNLVMGDLANKERDRMTSVIPQAFQYGQAEAQQPLQQAQAYQSLGALPRAVEQMLDTSNYQEWLRSQVDYPMDILNLAYGTQQPPLYQQDAPEKPSLWSDFLSGAGQGIGAGIGSVATGGLLDWLKPAKKTGGK